ncbi:hypothetical protein EY643_03045 [Halioglobus maricola]|uniref:Sulfotransferase family protein n=1 Tax=Halioglobus maricola TaxID=2601894 RepID=A0A5P9NHN5_9GAMM|nr:hypothetical protein [Halioglobus maricola]QFU74714.1 hypothetical protein EY643_03045 [Halioglobus maricola]
MSSLPRFKHCYLHIGLDKTGTTSVQRAFAREAALLESNCDLHFPHIFPDRVHFDGNHSPYLRALFCEFPRARRRLAARGLTSEEEIAHYNRTTLKALHAGFTATSATRLLLSAEVVTHFQQEDLESLKLWCQELAENITVIACIRHPVHALASEMQQRLRIGAKLENLNTHPPHHRLREKFTQLENIFGRSSVLAYSFHRATEHPSGLAAALLAELAIEQDSLFERERASNTSMSAEAARQLSAYNEQLPAFIEGRANPARCAQEVRRLAAIPGETFCASAEASQRVAELAASDIAWMEDRYSIDLRYRT